MIYIYKFTKNVSDFLQNEKLDYSVALELLKALQDKVNVGMTVQYKQFVKNQKNHP